MLNDRERIEVVRYRIENAYRTIDEVQSHIENGFYNTAVNRMYYACYYAASAILFDKRTKGDYNDLFDNDEATCNELYPQSRNFVAAIGKMAQQWLEEQQTITNHND